MHDAQTAKVQLGVSLYFGLTIWKNPNMACMYGLAAYVDLYCKSTQVRQSFPAMQRFGQHPSRSVIVTRTTLGASE